MNIVALIGPSGSGKSYKAIIVAREMDIDYIIDDGLLIKGTKVIAGKSAKRERSTVSAVKRALFISKSHKVEVVNAIATLKPRGILILGTSEKMVERIRQALLLPEFSRKVYIEDISTREEIMTARAQRTQEGKHVIPVPTFEIKKDFSGYFIDTLRIFRKKDSNEYDQEQFYEKSVVRPTFSYLGKYTISDGVIKDLVKLAANRVIGISRVLGIHIKNFDRGIVINIEIEMVYGNPIIPLIKRMQEEIVMEVEQMTSLNILGVNVFVKKMIKL